MLGTVQVHGQHSSLRERLYVITAVLRRAALSGALFGGRARLVVSWNRDWRHDRAALCAVYLLVMSRAGCHSPNYLRGCPCSRYSEVGSEVRCSASKAALARARTRGRWAVSNGTPRVTALTVHRLKTRSASGGVRSSWEAARDNLRGFRERFCRRRATTFRDLQTSAHAARGPSTTWSPAVEYGGASGYSRVGYFRAVSARARSTTTTIPTGRPRRDRRG